MNIYKDLFYINRDDLFFPDNAKNFEERKNQFIQCVNCIFIASYFEDEIYFSIVGYTMKFYSKKELVHDYTPENKSIVPCKIISIGENTTNILLDEKWQKIMGENNEYFVFNL